MPRIGERESFLADGSSIQLGIYTLTVVWDGTEREVEILAIGQERLLGTIMLEAYKLCLDFGNNSLTLEESA